MPLGRDWQAEGTRRVQYATTLPPPSPSHSLFFPSLSLSFLTNHNLALAVFFRAAEDVMIKPGEKVKSIEVHVTWHDTQIPLNALTYATPYRFLQMHVPLLYTHSNKGMVRPHQYFMSQE